MSAHNAVAIRRTGLVTSVGLSAAASCAAMRAKIGNPVQSGFMAIDGSWIQGHEVPLAEKIRGMPKLVDMCAQALREALQDVPAHRWGELPLLLCLAERQRPGRQPRLEEELFAALESALGTHFAQGSGLFPFGRVSVAAALNEAQRLLHTGAAPAVLIAAADSLMLGATLTHYSREVRLLSERNSNGFMPGEGAGALLVSLPGQGPELRCEGIGLDTEAATIAGDEPLRGEGLARAIRKALGNAGCAAHELDFRIADLSGEQYYFKEAALALTRTLHERKEAFDIWHPAETIGETGALAGVAMLAMAEAACRKGYAPGPGILAHCANDDGARAAMVLRHRMEGMY